VLSWLPGRPWGRLELLWSRAGCRSAGCRACSAVHGGSGGPSRCGGDDMGSRRAGCGRAAAGASAAVEGHLRQGIDRGPVGAVLHRRRRAGSDVLGSAVVSRVVAAG